MRTSKRKTEANSPVGYAAVTAKRRAELISQIVVPPDLQQFAVEMFAQARADLRLSLKA